MPEIAETVVGVGQEKRESRVTNKRLCVRSINTDLLKVDICESSCIFEHFDSYLGVDLELVFLCGIWTRHNKTLVAGMS
ncbi:hypothetical protein SAMN05216564_10755 [Halopenitus persicus]|uniref:Uncharacterized protein n=1 Tax=Halopenitus persicus TaxID=1048396 RepID=A0A1H3LGB1_9EURY|nr:hypothetical protein SAMN05216564_10755 [Halopenitus persicus]